MQRDGAHRRYVVAETRRGMTTEVIFAMGAGAALAAVIWIYRTWRLRPYPNARQFRSFWLHFPGTPLPETLELLRKSDAELEDYLRHGDREPIS